MLPQVRLTSVQHVTSKHKYSPTGDGHNTCLGTPGCAEHTGWEHSSCACAESTVCRATLTALPRASHWLWFSVCLFCCNSVVSHHFSFWKTVCIDLAAAYGQNSEDEHFIIPKISSRDGQLGEGTRTQNCTRRVIGSVLITPAINPHQWQWKYKAIKMEKRHKNRGKLKK